MSSFSWNAATKSLEDKVTGEAITVLSRKNVQQSVDFLLQTWFINQEIHMSDSELDNLITWLWASILKTRGTDNNTSETEEREQTTTKPTNNNANNSTPNPEQKPQLMTVDPRPETEAAALEQEQEEEQELFVLDDPIALSEWTFEKKQDWVSQCLEEALEEKQLVELFNTATNDDRAVRAYVLFVNKLAHVLFRQYTEDAGMEKHNDVATNSSTICAFDYTANRLCQLMRPSTKASDESITTFHRNWYLEMLSRTAWIESTEPKVESIIDSLLDDYSHKSFSSNEDKDASRYLFVWVLAVQPATPMRLRDHLKSKMWDDDDATLVQKTKQKERLGDFLWNLGFPGHSRDFELLDRVKHALSLLHPALLESTFSTDEEDTGSEDSYEGGDSSNSMTNSACSCAVSECPKDKEQ